MASRTREATAGQQQRWEASWAQAAVRSSQAGQATSAAQALELGSLRDTEQQQFANRVGALRGQFPNSTDDGDVARLIS